MQFYLNNSHHQNHHHLESYLLLNLNQLTSQKNVNHQDLSLFLHHQKHHLQIQNRWNHYLQAQDLLQQQVKQLLQRLARLLPQLQSLNQPKHFEQQELHQHLQLNCLINYYLHFILVVIPRPHHQKIQITRFPTQVTQFFFRILHLFLKF